MYLNKMLNEETFSIYKKKLTKIIFQIWKEKEKDLIDKINEARDNVKYLYKVESICQKFYTNDMVRKILLLIFSF